MNLKNLIFALFLSTILYADLYDPDIQVATDGDPLTTVCESVNLLSGDCVVFAQDHIIPGVEPIVLRRHYVSGDGKGKRAGWEFFPHLRLEVVTEKEKNITWKDYSRLEVHEPNGTRLVFKRQEKIDPRIGWVEYRIDFKKHGKGITNTARGEISGRTNLRNHRLIQESEYRILLHCADGTIRCYRRIFEKKRPVYTLRWEKLPSGSTCYYQYQDDGRLKKVLTRSKTQATTYAWCQFHYTGLYNVDIETSDGKVLSYAFKETGKRKDKQHRLKRIKSPSHPTEKISYEKGGRLKTRHFPQGRKIEVDYYEYPDRYPVKTLYQSIGLEGELLPTHTFKYDYENRITTVFDANGNKTSYAYNEDFQPFRITTFNQESPYHILEQKWGEYGQLEEKNQFDGAGNLLVSKRYTYDDRGNPIKIELIGNICHEGSRDISEEVLMYDAQNRLMETRSPQGLITRISYLCDTNLIQEKVTTDEATIFLRERNFYNEDNMLVQTIIDDGHETHITKIRLKQENPAQNYPEVIEEYVLQGDKELPLTQTHLTYDSANNLIEKQTYDANHTLVKTENFFYSQQGKLLKVEGPLNRSRSMDYDENGNLKKETQNGLKIIHRTFDTANRIRSETEEIEGHRRTIHINYDKKSNKIQESNPFGKTTNYSYDLLDRLIAIEHPNRALERYSYDPLGHLSTHTNPLGHATTYLRNIHGQPLRIIHPDKTQETFTYDLDGNCVTHTNQAGVTTDSKFDALGRETSRTILGTGVKETFTYNSFHLTSSIDQDGITTTYTYDDAGRKIQEKREDKEITFAYDSMGRIYQTRHNNLLAITHIYNALDQLIEERQGEITTLFAYDVNGNQTSIIHPNGEETFHYDPFNRLVGYIDPEGNATHTTYEETDILTKTTTNPLGRKTIEIFDSMMHLSRKEIWSREGLLIFAEDYLRNYLGQITVQKCHIYDQDIYTRSLLIEKTYDSMGRLIAIHEGNEKYTQYSYTPTGNLARLIKPDGIRLHYSYNNLDQLIRLSSSDHTIDYSYSYTFSGQLLTSHDHVHNLTTTRILDSSGNIVSETLANGLTLAATYDPLGRRTRLIQPTITIDYTYDALHLTSVTTLDQTATYTYDFSGNLLHLDTGIPIQYTYDRLNRPTSLTSSSYTQVLTYDADSNIIEFEDDDSYYDLRYDPLSQLIEEKNHTYAYDSYHNRLYKDNTPYINNNTHALIQADTTTYTYDANGNPLTKDTPFGSTTYTYDALDRLIAVTTPTSTIRYIYDSEHRRILKQSPTETLLYLYEEQDEIGCFSSDHVPLELRILGDKSHAERQTLYILLNNQLYLPITDLQGNIVRLKSPAESYAFQYNAFGEEHLHPHQNPWRYASKRHDPETNLIYFGRRYYDPITGRFLTPDPSLLTDSPNLYAYSRNNPWRTPDLYGLFSLFTNESKQSSFPQIDPNYMPYNPIEENAFLPQWQFVPFGQIVQSSTYVPEHSSIYDLGIPKEIPNKSIMYVNGMQNDFNEAQISAKYLSSLGNGINIHGIHSASQGFIGDVHHSKALLDFQETRTVSLIREALDAYFASSSPLATILIIAHSRGAAAVRNALMMYDEEKRSRTFVIAVAPAAYIDRKYCGDSIHYCSTKDFVHLFDSAGRRRNRDNIKMLPAKGGSWDHSIRSPTFQKSLEVQIKFYLKNGLLNDN